MTKSNGRPREDLEQQATAARTRLVRTLDELELRRERAMTRLRWFEKRAVPALLLALAGSSLLVSYLLFRRRPIVVGIARPGNALQTGVSLAISSALVTLLRARSELRLPSKSSLSGKLPDYR